MCLCVCGGGGHYPFDRGHEPSSHLDAIGDDLYHMPQSHTHLRTRRMVRKARPHISVHSVTHPQSP